MFSEISTALPESSLSLRETQRLTVLEADFQVESSFRSRETLGAQVVSHATDRLILRTFIEIFEKLLSSLFYSSRSQVFSIELEGFMCSNFRLRDPFESLLLTKAMNGRCGITSETGIHE